MRVRKYSQIFVQDLLAGLSGAIAGAPQAMGFAIIAGISPLYGLYTAVVSTVVGALTTSSVYMTVGPTNALALVVGSRLAPYSGEGLIERLFVLTLLVGVFQLAFGLLRFGYLVRYVSNAVMTGFITGAGILIIIGQLPHLTGYSGSEDAQMPLLDLLYWAENVPATHFHTVVIGVIAIVIISLLHRTRFRGAATLVALVFTAVLVAVLGWNDVLLVSDTSSVPSGLPSFTVPNLAHAPDLVSAALAIAVLASVQSAAISNMVSQPDGSSANVSADLRAQGYANVASGFFQGMPSGGSLSRTAVNIHAGARTRGANLMAGLLIAGMLVTVGRGVEYIPLAGLAGHLIVAASGLIDLSQVRLVWRVHWTARVAMVVTFCATLFLPLEYSIYIGVVLSIVFYVQTSSSAIKVARLVAVPDHRFREVPVGSHLPDHDTVIFTIAGDLYFAAVPYLEGVLPSPAESEHTTVILRLRDVQYVGSTAIRFLQRYHRQLCEHGGRLILAGVSSPVKEQLERAGLFAYLGKENIFLANDVVFSATEHALEQVSPHENTSEA